MPKSMDGVLKNLNPQQQAAVAHTTGPSIVLAGAGSGKTRVLIHKVAYLLSLGILPKNILMITFTNKAAEEMKTRISKISMHQDAKTAPGPTLGFIGTFHSFCAKVLRESGHHIGIERTFTIYTDDDQYDLLSQIVKKGEYGMLTPKFFAHKISEAKNHMITPESYTQTFSFHKAPQVAQVYEQYQSELAHHQAVDFDDLLIKTVQLFQRHPTVLHKYQSQYSYIMIDEFQDTNVAQYALAKLLASKDQNITVVGDFSQAIYSWRGANIRNLERFREDFPEAKDYRLEQNYRSTQRILNYAYEKITQNQTHPILKLFTQNGEGENVEELKFENEELEALYIAKCITQQVDKSADLLSSHDPYREFAVLYRTNAQSRVIEEVFLSYGIPYTLVGGTRFYERKEVKDVLCYLRLLIWPDDPVATERIRKLGKRKWEQFRNVYPDLRAHAATASPEFILELTLAKTGYLELYDENDPEDYARLENIKELKSVATTQPDLTRFFEQIALVENEYSLGERGKNNGRGVRLMSLHASKGLEFDVVFIVGLEEGLLPHSRSLDDVYALEEERRLFYVGITRARKKLSVSWTVRRGLFGQRTYSTKSRFITDSGKHIMWEHDAIPEPTAAINHEDKVERIISNWDS
jgi:DNA helicase-2/ATP-dependent DNA helicase PcrA